MNKRLLITLITAVFLIFGTIVAIRFAKGYRLDLKKKKIAATGLLVANSFPTGAQVFIDDKLTTATDDTFNLPPGEYKVKIIKDGFIPWEKVLTLKKEIVTQTNATLFPAVPDLKALTFTGALNAIPSPDGQKIAFSVASASSELKNGLWVLDLNSKPLALSRDPRQIARNSNQLDYTKAQFVWSPDSKQIIASYDKNNILLEAEKFNDPGSLHDVTARLSLILDEWKKEIQLKEAKKIEKLPLEMQKIATESAQIISWSPDEEKLLYTATASASILENLIPSLPGSNTQPEEREIKPDNIYLYDLKEDKNFFIVEKIKEEQASEEKSLSLIDIFYQSLPFFQPASNQQIQWFPDSYHLVLQEKDKLTILEYDGTNKDVVYAGPFEESFVYPWPDSSKLLILTSFNRETPYPPNLYAIVLK